MAISLAKLLNEGAFPLLWGRCHLRHRRTLAGVPDVEIRDFRPGDGVGIAQVMRENGAYHAQLAPDYFKQPDEEGLTDFVEADSEWRSSPHNLCLVAEIDGEVAGCIEATIQPPMDTARWQSQRDLSGPRLFIGFVQTADRFKRSGVATGLVEAAEQWGREKGALVAICDTYIDSPLSVPFWEKRMGYERRAVVLRKPLARPVPNIG